MLCFPTSSSIIRELRTRTMKTVHIMLMGPLIQVSSSVPHLLHRLPRIQWRAL